MLQRLDKYIYKYIYQEIDCLYTLFKNRFQSSIVASSGEVFIQLSRAGQRNSRWIGAENKPSIAKKRLILKKFNIPYLCSNQKLASTQIHVSAFLERIRKVQK